MYQSAVKILLESKEMDRIAGFQWSGLTSFAVLIDINYFLASFRLFSLNIHYIYEHYLDKLYEGYSDQRRSW